MMRYIVLSILCLSLLLHYSCREEEGLVSDVTLNFVHMMNDSPLVLNDSVYTNTSGNEYSISKLQYYVSNIILHDSQGGAPYIEPDSYHLIQVIDSMYKSTVSIQGVNLNKVSAITFSIGVDSISNHTIDHVGKGDLNTLNGMIWHWDTGYKFLILEGEFLNEEEQRSGIVFHIGGDENYKTLVFDLDQPTAEIDIEVNVSNFFESPNLIDLNTTSSVHAGGQSSIIAGNYITMFDTN